MGGGLSAIFSGRRGRLLKTGQTTSYPVGDEEPDDGHYEKGRTREAYDILTTGHHSGISNIDLVHLTATTIAFAATTPGTITDSGNALAMFRTGETIVISGSASNDGVYTVSTGNVAGTIRTTEATVFEAAGVSVSIAKREAHSNNCVFDKNTGLMWSRYTSYTYATMGEVGDGQMDWQGKLYDIFQYVAAANAARLGGFSVADLAVDPWRVPNVFELGSLRNFEPPNARPDITAFPSWIVTWYFWTSTVCSDVTTNRGRMHFGAGAYDPVPATWRYYCALVRGG